MTTRWVRGAALTALAGAAFVVPATPATAAAPAIRILSVSSENVESGGSVRVRFRATNNEDRAATVFVAVSGGLQCTQGCSASPNLGPGKSQTFEATLVAPQVHPSETSGRNLAVSVRVGRQTAFDHKMIFVHGSGDPSAPAAVRQVSGRVRDLDGKAVGGARVTVRDSAGQEYRATTDKGGKFTVRSGPIAAGAITVAATKDGYRTARATVRGAAGKTATVRLTLAATSTPSPSRSAVAGIATTTPEPTTEAAVVAAAPSPAARPTSDAGKSSPMFTVVGGLLIAAGVGALVLLLMRRRRRADEPAGMADAPTAVLRTVADPHGRPDHRYRG